MRLNRIGWMLALTAVMAGGGCGGDPSPDGEAPLKIVATTTIVGDLVRTIAGEHAEVAVLMGPGIDPHLYKASAGDVRRMSSAHAIIYNGLHLEGKMSEVLAEVGQRGVTTVAVAECIDHTDLISLEGYEGVHDPHVWFDVGLWVGAVRCLADAMVELDPAHGGDYLARSDALILELEELDLWVATRAEDLPADRRVLVTAHDAFSYFARAYGFEVRGLLGVSTASEAGTADVQELADFIVERQVPAIFVESSVSPRFVEALREAVAARGFSVVIGGTLYSDSLGNRDGDAGTYVGTVRANVETIVGALDVGE